MLRFLLSSWLLIASFQSSLAFVAVPTTTTTTSSRTASSSAVVVLNMSSSTTTKPEIEVISQPDREFLEKKGVFNWGTWGCEVSSFPWSYSENESAYLLKGKVTVTPTDGRKAVTFGKGDFVTFPAGMSCQWDVHEAVHKHFNFF